MARRRIGLVGARVERSRIGRARSTTPEGSAPTLPATRSPDCGGDEIKRGAGRAGAALDDIDEAAQPAETILLGQAVDLGLDGGNELIRQKALRVPGHVAESHEAKR